MVRLKRIALSILLLLMAILVVLHFWINYHAEYLLKKFIESESNGTLAFNATQVKVMYLDGRVEFYNSTLKTKPADDSSKNQSDIHCKKLVLQLKNVLPLITGKNIYIDSVVAESPGISITKNIIGPKKQVNLAEEWGNIYKGLIKSVNEFYINKLIIRHADFTLLSPKEKIAPIHIRNINFSINQLYAGVKKSKKPAITVKEIELLLGREKIVMPGNREISFKKFSINTQSGNILLDSCTIYNSTTDRRSAVKIYTDSLNIHQLDFANLYNGDGIKAARLQLARPLVELSLHPNTSKDSLDKKTLTQILAEFNTSLDLGELVVSNARTNIVTSVQGKTNRFAIDDVNFYIKNLNANYNNNSNELVRYDSICLLIQGHKGATEDSSLIFENGLFAFVNDKVTINNINLTPSPLQAGNRIKSIRVKQVQINNISLKNLLFDNIFKANSLTITEPKIELQQPAVIKKRRPGKLAEQQLQQLLQVNDAHIINGEVSYTDGKGTTAAISQLNITAGLQHIFNLQSPLQLLKDIQQLGWKNASIRLPGGTASIQNARLDANSRRLLCSQIQVSLSTPAVHANLQNAELAINRNDTSASTIHLAALGWQKGKISFADKPLPAKKRKPAKPISLLADTIWLHNTSLQVAGRNQTISSMVQYASTSKLALLPGQKPAIGHLTLSLQNSRYHSSKLQAGIRQLSITGSTNIQLRGIAVNSTLPNGKAEINLQGIQLNAAPAQLLQGKLNFDKVLLYKPVITLNTTGNSSQLNPASKKPLPAINIAELRVQDAAGSITTQQKDQQPVSIYINKLDLLLNKLSTNNSTVAIASSSLSSKQVTVKKDSNTIFTGALQMEGNKALLQNNHWSYQANRAGINDATLQLIKNDSVKTTITVGQLHLLNWILNDEMLSNKHLLATHNNTAGLDIKKLNTIVNNEAISICSISAKNISQQIQISDVALSPVLNRLEFIAASPWETDDIRFKAAKVFINNWHSNALLDSNLLQVNHIAVHEPDFSIYRDKNKPDEQNVYKPLPVTSFKNAPFKFRLDTAEIIQGHVLYNEKSEITQLTGKVEFNELKARITNIKSTGYTQTDSLRLRASALFMNKALVKVRIDESYADSLAGFLFTASLAPTNLDILNNITEAAASVQVKSGYVDTMYLHAIAREYLSLGTMYLPYHQLKVKFLKKGNKNTNDVLSGLITFAANTFVIKTNNRHRKGVIYFPRLRDQAIFNYMAKMFLSGAASSAGAKSNKKALRQYRKALKQHQLPPIRPLD